MSKSGKEASLLPLHQSHSSNSMSKFSSTKISEIQAFIELREWQGDPLKGSPFHKALWTSRFWMLISPRISTARLTRLPPIAHWYAQFGRIKSSICFLLFLIFVVFEFRLFCRVFSDVRPATVHRANFRIAVVSGKATIGEIEPEVGSQFTVSVYLQHSHNDVVLQLQRISELIYAPPLPKQAPPQAAVDATWNDEGFPVFLKAKPPGWIFSARDSGNAEWVTLFWFIYLFISLFFFLFFFLYSIPVIDKTEQIHKSTKLLSSSFVWFEFHMA